METAQPAPASTAAALPPASTSEHATAQGAASAVASAPVQQPLPADDKKVKIAEYLSKRVTFRDSTVGMVSGGGGYDGSAIPVSTTAQNFTTPYVGIDPPIAYSSPTFYQYIGRVDLADQHRRRVTANNLMGWGGCILGLGSLGVMLVVPGVNGDLGKSGGWSKYSSSSRSAVVGGGIGFTVGLILAFIGTYRSDEIMDVSDKQLLGRKFNDKLKQKIGITNADLVSRADDLGTNQKKLSKLMTMASELQISPVYNGNGAGLALFTRF